MFFSIGLHSSFSTPCLSNATTTSGTGDRRGQCRCVSLAYEIQFTTNEGTKTAGRARVFEEFGSWWAGALAVARGFDINLMVTCCRM